MKAWLNFLPLVSGILTFGLLRWMLAGRRAQWALDHPNHRSLHSAPVPRVGGLGIMAGVLLTWLGLGMPGLLSCALLLVLVSFADDLYGLSVRWRFLGHLMAATVWVWLLLPLPVLLAAVLVLGLVWMTNLYNFMDGSDGLAGGMALFGFGAYAAAAWLGGDAQLAIACAAIAASALAFLAYNFHPARIFMGDAGSIPLGFLSGAIGLLGWQRGLWPLWFPVLAFSPFIVDATVTLMKRLLRGEKIWQAHRTHYYQRLVQMGWGHRNTALAEYGLMLLAAASAMLGIRMQISGQVALVLGWGLAYCALAIRIDRRWAAWQEQPDV